MERGERGAAECSSDCVGVGGQKGHQDNHEMWRWNELKRQH